MEETIHRFRLNCYAEDKGCYVEKAGKHLILGDCVIGNSSNRNTQGNAAASGSTLQISLQ
jgi:hypothetical protein